MAEVLTDAKLKSMIAASEDAGATRVEAIDRKQPGLRVRVSGGKARFAFWYRTRAGVARRLGIGVYSDKLTLTVARKKARGFAAEIYAGLDPASARDAERAAEKAREAAGTFGDLLDRFVEDQSGNWRPATRSGWIRFLNAEVKPVLGKKAPRDVTTADVRDLIDAIKRRGSPVASRRCLEVVRRACAWAVWKGLIPVSPAEAAKPFERQRRKKGRVAAAREKAYKDEQLAALFGAAEHEAAEAEAEFGRRRRERLKQEIAEAHAIAARQFLNLLWLVSLTAVRAHDARAARWSEFDLDQKVWTVDSHKTSDAEGPHTVQLSDAVIALLGRIRRSNLAAGLGRRNPWLFPVTGDLPCEVCERVGHAGKDQKAATRIRKAAGVDVRGLLHNMRHVIKTRMSEHSIEGRVSEAVLGHALSGIESHYDHAVFERKRREALAWWAEELARLVAAPPTPKPSADVVSIAAHS